MECFFLVKFPIEIREMVYKFALKYEKLVEVDQGAWSCAPALLKSCRQIYDEALPIFYQVNTFMYNVAGYLRRNGTRCGPIYRKLFDLRKIQKLVIKLRHLPDWNPPRDYEVACRTKVARLCCALFQVSGLEIEVLNCEDFQENYDIMEVLEPLGSLRNVRRIEFQGAFENPFAVDEHAFFHELTRRMMGSSPTESSFNMYKNLKEYALSFERHIMRKAFIDFETPLPCGWSDWNDHASFFSLAFIANLRQASSSAAADDLDPFRFRRRRVLFYLEKQYLQIKMEKNILFNPVVNLPQPKSSLTRAQKLVEYHFKEDAPTHNPMAGIRALLALARFADSFKHITDMANAGVPLYPSYDPVYDYMEREKALMALYNAAIYEGSLTIVQRQARKTAHRGEKLYDWTECRRFFKIALRDMLAQHGDILRARKHIFKGDIVADISYNVRDWEFEDSADTVYRDDDPEKPQDIESQELLFGIANPLPTITNTVLEKARLLGAQEAPGPAIDVGPSKVIFYSFKGIFYRTSPGVPINSTAITLFAEVAADEGHADRPEGGDPCAYRDPGWPSSDSVDPWNLDIVPLTRRRSMEFDSPSPESSNPPARCRRRSF